MNTVLLIINALLPIAVTELEQYAHVSPSIGNLITGIGNAASAFASEITTNNGAASITATSILSAISAAVVVLQTQTTVNPQTLSIINALDKAITAGLAVNVTTVDPTQLNPITPVA